MRLSSWLPWSLLGLALISTACDGSDGPADGAADASVPDGSGDAGSGVAPPAPAAAPNFGPCPEGYRAFDADGVTACDPWPETGRAACSAGEAHFPGTPGCALVGPACPADGFPADLPVGPALYVSEGATGGTGSRDQPFGTVTEALAIAAPGDVVAIGVGTYRERVSLPSGVKVIGACAAGVTIRGADAAGAAASLRHVTLGGGLGSGLLVGPDRGISLDGVIIHEASYGGIVVRGGTITGRQVVVTDTINVEVDDGCGVTVRDGGSAEFDELVIGRARAEAVYVTGAGSSATIRGGSIFDVRPDADDHSGLGVLVNRTGSITLEDVIIDGARSVGILGRTRATVTLTGVIIRNTAPRMSDSAFGRALSALEATTITATRFLAENNHDIGVFAEDAASVINLSHAIIRDMKSEASDGSVGRCINIQNGGAMNLDHALLVRCRDIGLLSHGEAARVEASDLTIRDTLDQEIDPQGGWGLGAQHGAVLVLDRAHVEGSTEIGLYAHGLESMIEARDVTVRDTASDATTGAKGRGVSIQLGAEAAFERLLVEGSHEEGMVAIGAMTRIVGKDVTIRDTASAACVVDGCESNASNLSSFDEAEIDITRFEFDGAEICGVWLDQGGALDLRRGAIRGNAIGACIIDDAFDVTRISDDVRYEDNGTNLDSPTLPVPTPVDPAAI
ncbi:MAG: hypothetical protein DRJ42_12380 [Deltaproteobacteria bacterium]|nr:MAG: hypothetical protein DRJ42_12380 [Deltaproteobacteria bacterium]